MILRRRGRGAPGSGAEISLHLVERPWRGRHFPAGCMGVWSGVELGLGKGGGKV